MIRLFFLFQNSQGSDIYHQFQLKTDGSIPLRPFFNPYKPQK